MFTLPVGDLLASYAGDSKNFSFSGEIFDGYFEDIRFVKPLEFSIRLMALDDGVDVRFESLKTTVVYDGKEHSVVIAAFDRMWKTQIDPLSDGDDVRPIDMKNHTIDLAPVLREEIIMACHQF